MILERPGFEETLTRETSFSGETIHPSWYGGETTQISHWNTLPMKITPLFVDIRIIFSSSWDSRERAL